MTPPYKAAMSSALDGADSALDQLNILAAYAVEPADHEQHLDTVQDLQAALAALRSDVDAL